VNSKGKIVRLQMLGSRTILAVFKQSSEIALRI